MRVHAVSRPRWPRFGADGRSPPRIGAADAGGAKRRRSALYQRNSASGPRIEANTQRDHQGRDGKRSRSATRLDVQKGRARAFSSGKAAWRCGDSIGGLDGLPGLWDGVSIEVWPSGLVLGTDALSIRSKRCFPALGAFLARRRARENVDLRH
jgi:hypothetical protein